ncbi:MAG: hypothetical protein J6X44_14100 [Thermoguttaceae bacterium]|nr:hypothetical protein [Thermoguttaceae bacterium]
MNRPMQFDSFSHNKIESLCLATGIILLAFSALNADGSCSLWKSNDVLYAQEDSEHTLIYSSKNYASNLSKRTGNKVKSIESDEVDELEEKTDVDAHDEDEGENPSSYDSQTNSDESISPDIIETSEFALAPPERDIDVLIDMRHAYDFSDFPLTIDDRLYHRIYSFHRAFTYLKSQGVQVEKYESNEPLSYEYLSRCKTLFLNLPSADKEPFLLSELVSIKKYIEEGGSAFFIVDHTNCYFHQSCLKPLFHELDIEPQFYSICDATQNIGAGYGWIYFNKFAPCPITDRLRQIAFQTGGGVDPRYAVVWSSEASWQDSANIPIYGEADLGYFGNFAQDEDERVGANGSVLVKEIGRGKIVVVGDQNIFSPFFLQYLDNYRLWINSFAWLLNVPELADPQRYVASGIDEKRVLCWEELRPNAKRFGDPDPKGYYDVYSALCRYYNVFCIANDDTDIGLVSNVLIWIDADEETSQEGVEFAYKQLERGKTLLVLDPAEGVLDKDDSPLTVIIRKLEEKGVQTKKNNATVASEEIKGGESSTAQMIEFSNGGKIIALHGKDSFDNSSVPAPESKPLFLQQENLKTLMKTIDSELTEK